MHRAGIQMLHAHAECVQVFMCSEIKVCFQVKWLLKLPYVHKNLHGLIVFHKTVQYEI